MSEYLCSACGASASFCKKIAVNGVVKSTYYCANCSDAMNVNNNVSTLVSDMFSAGKGNVDVRIRTCNCGLTDRDILADGKFGCSECYNTFRNVAEDFISSRNLGYHNGKLPTRNRTNPPSVDKNTVTLDMLRKEFARAMIEERYLDVDVISKKISDIES